MTWFTKKNAVKKELQGKSNRHKFSDTRFLEHKFFAMSSKTRLASPKVSTLPDKQKEEREGWLQILPAFFYLQDDLITRANI